MVDPPLADNAASTPLMPQTLNERLATAAGRRAFDREIADLIRAGDFAAADSSLVESLGGYNTPIARAARATRANGVMISGLVEISHWCEELVRRGTRMTAVGMNLSNYNDSETDEWHDKEPAIEVAI